MAAKLFEAAHKAQAEAKISTRSLYDQAKDLYLEAFYRINLHRRRKFGGLPQPHGGRRVSAAMRWPWPEKAEALLRQALAKAGVESGRHQPGAGQIPAEPGREALELQARRRI